MKLEIKKLSNLFVMMVCGIVGVGFISGAEIYEFFVKFGNYYYIGIAVFFVLNFILSYKILASNTKSNITLKMQKIDNNKAKSTNNSKNLIKSILIFVNVLLMSAAMISGIKILAINLLNNNYILVIILCLLFIFSVLLFGIKGLSKVDYFVFIFVLVITIFFAGNKSANISSSQVAANADWAFGGSFGQIVSIIIFACLYVFMNIVQVEPLYKESELKLSKGLALIFSLIFSAFLTSVLVVFVSFLMNHSELFDASMPFLKYFSNMGGAVYVVFVFGLFFAIITTLLSCLIGVKRGMLNVLGAKVTGFKTKKQPTIVKNELEFSKNKKKFSFNFKNFVATMLSVALAFVLSFVGFNIYVSIIYPIIGVVNFIIFVFL